VVPGGKGATHARNCVFLLRTQSESENAKRAWHCNDSNEYDTQGGVGRGPGTGACLTTSGEAGLKELGEEVTSPMQPPPLGPTAFLPTSFAFLHKGLTGAPSFARAFSFLNSWFDTSRWVVARLVLSRKLQQRKG
jgi:hypothetical protein